MGNAGPVRIISASFEPNDLHTDLSIDPFHGSVPLHGVNVLLGQNSSGKTTLLERLEGLFCGDSAQRPHWAEFRARRNSVVTLTVADGRPAQYVAELINQLADPSEEPVSLGSGWQGSTK